jgi:uncharacterized membrane protein (Fun14 family)
MIPSNLLTPVIGELGIGGIGGLCVGYALKKIAKIIAFFIAIGFVCIQYLANIGVISINYAALQNWLLSMIGNANALQGFIVSFIAQMSFGIGFVGGFIIGIKKG